jgi:hypothetical protein
MTRAARRIVTIEGTEKENAENTEKKTLCSLCKSLRSLWLNKLC